MFRKALAGGVLVAALAAAAAVVSSPLAAAHSHSQPTGVPGAHRSCPATDRHVLTSTTAGAADKLVPAGARQVLLCRYRGLDPTPALAGQLVAHHLVTGARTVRRLRSEFNALERFPSGVMSCPVDLGTEILAIFRYSAKADDPVSVEVGGCSAVTNGRLTRTAMLAPGPALIAQLEAKTR